MTIKIPPNLDRNLQEKVFVSTVGAIPTLPAAEIDAFLLEVHRCCLRMLANPTNLEKSACAFVLTERLEVDPAYERYSSDFGPSIRLDDVAAPEIPGPIILTTMNLRLAFARPFDDDTVAGIAKELVTMSLGDRPTLIFVPSQRTLTFYKCGVSGNATFKANADSLKALDPSNLVAVLEFFHERYTRYPDGLGTCWDNAKFRVVERHAERNIRNHLFNLLSMVVYGTDYIARELQLPNGRVDIFVYGIVFGEKNGPRVIELKVLRSKSIGWTPGKPRTYGDAVNKRYAEKGLRQAKRYMDASGALEAYLCCFDARLQDLELDIIEYANVLGVTFRRYFMESSTSEPTD